MSWTNLFMVPLIMVCALGGTVGLIKLITRFNNRNANDKNTEQMSERRENHE